MSWKDVIHKRTRQEWIVIAEVKVGDRQSVLDCSSSGKWRNVSENNFSLASWSDKHTHRSTQTDSHVFVRPCKCCFRIIELYCGIWTPPLFSPAGEKARYNSKSIYHESIQPLQNRHTDCPYTTHSFQMSSEIKAWTGSAKTSREAELSGDRKVERNEGENRKADWNEKVGCSVCWIFTNAAIFGTSVSAVLRLLWEVTQRFTDTVSLTVALREIMSSNIQSIVSSSE